MEDQVLEELDNCITTMKMCCKKGGYHRRQIFTGVNEKTSPLWCYSMLEH